MKLLAQHGFGDGNRIIEGLDKSYIKGVVFSPRDINSDKLVIKIDEIRKQFTSSELLFDPQFYISTLGSSNVPNIGKLNDYDYFLFKRKSELEREAIIKNIIREVIKYQISLPLSSIISPNILISKSFDSVEAVISKNFIRLSKEVYNEFKDKRRLFVTLAISRDTLANREELKEFLNDITLIDNPPDGFYLLISTRSSDARSDIYNLNVISGWMFLNYVLKINGFKIINGYSDIMSFFLSSVGADFNCTGWWSNLRTFSLDRFTQSSTGGRLPIQRYLSKKLINRITHFEFKDWKILFPEITNNIKTDEILLDDEPDRSKEVFQSWDTLNYMINELKEEDFSYNLKKCKDYIEQANELYIRIKTKFRPDPKSNDEHLEPLSEGIKQFEKLAEF